MLLTMSFDIYKTECPFHLSVSVTNFTNKISGAKYRNLYFELNVFGRKFQYLGFTSMVTKLVQDVSSILRLNSDKVQLV